MEQKEERCLKIAENILQALDNKSIFMRYLRIKNYIFSKAYSDSNKIIESPILKNYSLEELIREKIYKEIISPNSCQPQPRSLTDSIRLVKSIIDTEQVSHQFLKSKISKENEKLRNSILKIRTNSIQTLNITRKGRVETGDQWECDLSQLSERINQNKIQISFLKDQMLKIENDNAKLMSALNSIKVNENEIKILSKILINAVNHRNEQREKVIKLKHQMRSIIKKTNKIRKIQLIPDEDNLITINDRLTELKESIQNLEKQNKQYTKDLQLYSAIG